MGDHKVVASSQEASKKGLFRSGITHPRLSINRVHLGGGWGGGWFNLEGRRQKTKRRAREMYSSCVTVTDEDSEREEGEVLSSWSVARRQ